MKKRKPIETNDDGINVDELLGALSLLSPALEKKEIVQEQTHYLFLDNKIATYNEDRCVILPFNVGISGGVKASDLYAIVKRLQGHKDKIQLIPKRRALKIKVGRRISGVLNFYSPGESYNWIKDKSEELEKAKWKRIEEDVVKAMVLCSFSASKNLTKPFLNGVYISEKDIIASDNYRSSLVKKETKVKNPLLIPAAAVVFLKQFKPTRYVKQNGWLFFKNGDAGYFGTTLFNEKDFPANSIKKWLKEDWKTPELKIPKGLTHVLERASFLLSDQLILDKSVIVEIGKEAIRVLSQREGRGKYEEEMKVSWKKFKGDALKVELNPDWFIEALKYGVAKIAIGKTKIFLRAKDFKHVLILVKDND